MPTEETRRMVLAAAEACADKKAEDTRILELDPADSGLADFFLITSASNDRQVVAIADAIEFRLKQEFGTYAHSVEGRRQGEWVLLDYVDFVVHVFLAERRSFYDIERLRKSARPLTPAELDEELKATLAAKTRAVRKKTPAKSLAKAPAKIAKAPAKATQAPNKKAQADQAETESPAAKKPAAEKAPTTKTATKKWATKKAVTVKPAVKKAAAKKAPTTGKVSVPTKQPASESPRTMPAK